MSTPAPIAINRVQMETLEWRPRAPNMYSRAEVARQTGAYEAAVPARIAQWVPVLPAADLSEIEDATRRLVEFDVYAGRALAVDDAVLGPMTAILLRTESASSSQIEQLTASAKQIALAEVSEEPRPNAHMVLGNVRAMEAALALADDLSLGAILSMHEALMVHQPGFDTDNAGSLRTEQVWIGGGNAGPRGADFIAPRHELVGEAIADLVQFMGRDDLPILVQAAVAHAQFETIHPFTDGNGRTGRALVHSLLKNKGLVRSSAVPLSGGLLVNLERYFQALGTFRRGDAGPIIRQFTQASTMAVIHATRLVEKLVAELESSRQKMAGVRSNAAAWRVLPLLIGQPAVTVRHLMVTLGLNEMAALRAVSTLTERGVLEEITGRARDRIWHHRGILEELDHYAKTLRR